MGNRIGPVSALALSLLFTGCAAHKSPAPVPGAEKKRQERRLEANNAAVPEETAQTADDYERLGDRNLSGNDPANALLNYERALRIEPRRKSALYKKGRVFLARGMTIEARGEFEQMLAGEPDNVPGNEGLGRAYLLDGKIDDAIRHLTLAEKGGPSWEVHNLLGVCFDRRRSFSDAVYHYQAAIAINPAEGALYNNLGVSYLMTGQIEKAEDAFTAAIERKEERGRVYNNLALSLGSQGKYREAFEAFAKAGNEAAARNNLGYVYLLGGKKQEALASFEKAIELSPAFYVKAYDNYRTTKNSPEE